MVGCTDCSPELSGEHQDPIFRRVLWFALIVNFGMFVVEIVASYFGDSVSLQADALDFFGDAANYAISLFVLGMALHVRARASLFKGITMGAFGLWVLVNAGYRAYVGSAPEPSIMGAIALLALIANVSVAVTLFRYREGDSNMRSIWLCNRKYRRNDRGGRRIYYRLSMARSYCCWPDCIFESQRGVPNYQVGNY